MNDDDYFQRFGLVRPAGAFVAWVWNRGKEKWEAAATADNRKELLGLGVVMPRGQGPPLSAPRPGVTPKNFP